MFYDLTTLTKGGKFCLIWRAANCGVKTLKDKEVLSIDICRISEQVLKLVCSRSSRPEQRVSLFLSAKLLSGILRVYGRQVDLLFNDLSKYYAQAKTLSFFTLPEEVEEDSVGTPRAVIKRTKKTVKKAAQVPQQQENALQLLEASIMQIDEEMERMRQKERIAARRDEITIREVNFPQAKELPAEANVPGEELESFIDQFISLPEIPAKPLEQPQPSAAVKRKATDAIESLLKDVADAPIPATNVVEVEEVAAAAAAPQTTDVEGTRMEERGASQKSRIPRNRLLINVKLKKRVPIDLSLSARNKMFYTCDDSPMESEEELLKPVDFDVIPMLRHYLARNELVREADGAGQLSSKNVSSFDEAHVLVSSTPKSRSMLQTGSRLLPSIREEINLPRDKELEISNVEMPIETGKLQPIISTSAISGPIARLSDERVRSGNDESAVLDALANLNAFGQDRVTIEDVAERPLTKRTVASAFGLLLDLAKKRHVKLHSREGSCELSHIELYP